MFLAGCILNLFTDTSRAEFLQRATFELPLYLFTFRNRSNVALNFPVTLPFKIRRVYLGNTNIPYLVSGKPIIKNDEFIQTEMDGRETNRRWQIRIDLGTERFHVIPQSCVQFGSFMCKNWRFECNSGGFGSDNWRRCLLFFRSSPFWDINDDNGCNKAKYIRRATRIPKTPQSAHHNA